MPEAPLPKGVAVENVDNKIDNKEDVDLSIPKDLGIVGGSSREKREKRRRERGGKSGIIE
jgi:hypothetical protein